MKFELLPILDTMEVLYSLPRNQKRFEHYLFLLQGPKKEDLILPIGGFNPMGKENVLQKLRELKTLGAEAILSEEMENVNANITSNATQNISVAINLSDDVGGLWSNLYTSDYTNKFDFNAIARRNFCTPYFWTSEEFSKELIAVRSKEYMYRTLHWLEHGKPITLEDHINQEVFVERKTFGENKKSPKSHVERIEQFYMENKQSEDYNLIFNFLYGDVASKALGYSCHGMEERSGFRYARHLAGS